MAMLIRSGFRRLAALAFLLVQGNPAWALTDLVPSYGGCAQTQYTQTVSVGPADDYQSAVDSLQPGQRLQLQAGTYGNGLRIYNRNGDLNNCIAIEGPPDHSAIFVGLPINGIRNVVQIRNSSFVVLRNLRIDGSGTTDLDALKSDANIAGGHPFAWSHHLTVENLWIHDFDFDQQQVGISTKGPAWNWVVRHNRIERVGTGMYFGNSNGAEHFVNGLIEFNLVTDSVGYNAQIKHQFSGSRPSGTGFESLPNPGRTVIRHNVFSKGPNSSSGGNARPNLLLGSPPLSGPGSEDDFVVAQNFFYRNPTGFEALVQGEGHLIIYGNLLYNDQGPALAVQPQNGEVRRVRLFHNTVVSSAGGIFVSSSVNPGFSQLVRGNAVFADGTPISGGSQMDNIVGTQAAAAQTLNDPLGGLPLDLYPQSGALTGPPPDVSVLAGYPDAGRDFNDQPRDLAIRGGYGGSGSNPGWELSLSFKQLDGDGIHADGFE